MGRKTLIDRPNGTTEYLLKGIPVPLWRACIEKAAKGVPRYYMTDVILTMLARWLKQPDSRPAKIQIQKELTIRLKGIKKMKAKRLKNSLPDLTDVF